MVYGGIIFLLFTIGIADCLKDIRALLIPTKKQKTEIVLLLIGSLFIMAITYLYAKSWFHYILGILGTAYLILSWARIGITAKGFNSLRGYGSPGKWNRLRRVHVSLKNNVRVSFIRRNYYEDIHYYDSEDYDIIVTLLLENLPDDVVQIV